MSYCPNGEDPSNDIDMINLLLAKGVDPNQIVFLYDGETVWGHFLSCM